MTAQKSEGFESDTTVKKKKKIMENSNFLDRFAFAARERHINVIKSMKNIDRICLKQLWKIPLDTNNRQTSW